jgi:hypothetical protein
MQMGQASSTRGETGKRSTANWGTKTEEQGAGRAVTRGGSWMRGWQASYGAETTRRFRVLSVG